MRLFRVAEEKIAPSWAFEPSSLDDYKDCTLSTEDLQRLSKEHLDDASLDNECSLIEKCASKNKKYYFNQSWNKADVSHLREYSIACGLVQDNFVGLPQDKISSMQQDLLTIESNVDHARLSKTASGALADSPESMLKDPFRIDEHINSRSQVEDNWQIISKSKSLGDKPSITGGISPLRGDDDYYSNSESKLPVNQNSITDPNAIQKFMESDTKDNGVRLAEQRREKEARKKMEHEQWQKEIIDDMSVFSKILPKGKVFPTQELNAASGIHDRSMVAYSKFDLKDLPEKTEGEQLVDRQEERRMSIQRPKQEDDWQHMSTSSHRQITDDFAESLASQLRKKE